MYKKSGLKNVKIKLYAQMRHEILNEIDKDKVYLDIYIKSYSSLVLTAIYWRKNIEKKTGVSRN